MRFTYDLNGVIEVEATVVATKQKISHVITKHAKNLDDKQLRVAIEAMRTLKQHPREEAANRFLLRRAERLYAELTHVERDHLSELMDGFEAVLELKDAEAMSVIRPPSKNSAICTRTAAATPATKKQTIDPPVALISSRLRRHAARSHVRFRS
ncbi:MAG: hypothetical protein QM811_18435 [Pirellulales bacterium]